MPITTVGIVSAVTPSVVETYLSHYLNRGQLRQKPTAHISYHEGLRLLRQFLDYSSKHTVEDLQAFTAQWVPAPTWVKLENVEINLQYLDRAAKLLEAQLGPVGIEKVGGSAWWQWRRSGSSLRAEWIEMKKDINERKLKGGKVDRVMMYVHGGAYYMASVDEHRYQIQRHARKLKARVLAPRYRLAPQYPFPCGLQDALASYLFLLDVLDHTQILVCGDSAGAGMIISMLVTLRDQEIPLPAGAMLLSPWVDLTHSFPSVAGEGKQDYIPPHGFHHKPSLVWPPPNEDELEMLNAELAEKQGVEKADKLPGGPANLSITIDGEQIELKDQIQMYATNALLMHPLVSPVQQPSLGGLPPLLIQTGGGELLHDEQVYLAHKAANPQKYRPSDAVIAEFGLNKDDVTKYDPTYVQLQVWEDLCHVPHTLSFTRPAKYMFRSVAQFGAWALAHAQQKDVEIEDDANSIISSGPDTDIDAEDSLSSTVDLSKTKKRPKTASQDPNRERRKPTGAVGRAGDPLPTFKEHMIRQRVDRHGITYPLTPAAEMLCLKMEPSSVGAIKPGPVRKWLAKKKEMDSKFASEKKKVQKKRLKEMSNGYERFPSGDAPPPTALAGRRSKDMPVEKKAKKSWALSLWSGWGSHHDEETLERNENIEELMLRPSSGQTSNSAATAPVAKTDMLAPHDRMVRKVSSNSALSVPQHDDSRPRSPLRKVSDIGQANEPMRSMNADVRSPLVSPMLSEDGFHSPPRMAQVAPDSTRVEGSENTFTSPGSNRPHNGVSAYPFKLRNPMSSASTATLDDNQSATGETMTTTSTPAQSVAPVESLVAEKEVMIPYYEKEVVAVSAPYDRLQRTPSELAGRPMTSQVSLPGTPRFPDTYSPASGSATHSGYAASPIETYRPVDPSRVRNPAFDHTGEANHKFSGMDIQSMGPPKPVGFAYNPRDLRNAMISRQQAADAGAAAYAPTQQPSRLNAAPLSPTGYVAPVELPATAAEDTVSALPEHRRPSAVAMNDDSDPIELSIVKQTRNSMLPPPRGAIPDIPTLEMSAYKQTRNSVLPAPRTMPSQRPESPSVRPGTVGSDDISVSETSSSAAIDHDTAQAVSPTIEQRRPVPAQIRALAHEEDKDLPPTPPPKDERFSTSSVDEREYTHSRVTSNPPVLGNLSISSGLDLGLDLDAKMDGLSR